MTLHLVEEPTPKCGIYFLVRDGKVIYVGQSRDIVFRVATHRKDGKYKFDFAMHVDCPPEMLNAAETWFILKLSPQRNGKPQRPQPYGKQLQPYAPPPDAYSICEMFNNFGNKSRIVALAERMFSIAYES